MIMTAAIPAAEFDYAAEIADGKSRFLHRPESAPIISRLLVDVCKSEFIYSLSI